ncbi:enoyl-CoA hydratase/isomerase family protein [Marinibaculum pumilum]|uniref:Enoyl-CoA hydratase/isomerase family protein n=1 Tax=Marinibaculum pumilum TaxID=1766165 RepID=A0ABV7L360_9PROT
MAYRSIDLEVRQGVGWLRFNRTPVNAVDWAMMGEMHDGFVDLVGRPEVRVVVIASALERYFSAGADIQTFRDTDDDGVRRWIAMAQRLALAVRAADKPVLAAINGTAVGGGLEMVLHADLRFAASDARFGQPEVNIAFIPPVGGTQGLVRLVGRGAAFRILYDGTLIDAEQALAIGLVDELVAPETLVDRVQAYATGLASKPANALAAIRRCLIDGGAMAFADGLAVEKAQAEALAGHPNFREGIAAFLEKRKPGWR